MVVFNFPDGDTVINKEEYQSEQPYYQVARELGNGDINAGRQIILNDPDQYPLIVRPVDKQENYIKRCTGIAGDTLQIINQMCISMVNSRRCRLILRPIISWSPADNSWMKP